MFKKQDTVSHLPSKVEELLELIGMLLSVWCKFGVNEIAITAETCPLAIQTLPFGSTLPIHAPSTLAM